MMVNEQELNKKLAEWRGFTIGDYPEPTIEDGEQAWFDPNGMFYSGLDNFIHFPHSLDACFKWLVPLAVVKLANINLSTIKEATQKLFQLWTEQDATSHALALCLAIEKMIDGGHNGR